MKIKTNIIGAAAVRNYFAIGCTLLFAAGNIFAQDVNSGDETDIEEIVVLGKSRVFSNNEVTESMTLQQSPVTSVNAVIDNLPGVSVQEGDTYGFDDWSTTISVRGFQVSLDEQQIGTTIDGMPNGNSNYGGGAKANRYIDSANLGGVEVSQGTADIASRSLEALGGTINYSTDQPLEEKRVRAQVGAGEFDAQRFYVRYDTGLFAGDNRAWFSVSHQNASDWVNGIADNNRDHFAAKLISEFGDVRMTGYLSYDDTHEDNYQRLFSPDEFSTNPEWDRLTDQWTGIPYVDQVFRQGWSTLRENTFAYLKADWDISESVTISAAAYYHENEGRGDWIPPYVVDVVDDAGGSESEVSGNAGIDGGAPFGRIYFVDGSGVRQDPIAGCVSTISFPYGGAGPESDPACHPAGSLAVQSYRHTHYAKERTGFSLDAEWSAELGGLENMLRGGVWSEDATRDEYRDWHKISDTRVGIAFDNVAYWTQYNRSYPQDTAKWYAEDSLRIGELVVTLGLKQYFIDVERQDLFGDSPGATINSDSDVLISGGLLWEVTENLEVFGGYAENFKAISDLVLERPNSDLATIQPETAENLEFGARFHTERASLTATYYDTDFSNRIIFLSAETASGPNYEIGTNGTYFNAGGIESSGLEISGTLQVMDSIGLYMSYSSDDSSYLGTGDSLVDGALGIIPGNDVVGIPESQLVTSLDFALTENAHAGITAKYTGDRQIRIDNSWQADANTITDFYLNMTADSFDEMLQGLSINFVVNNVFDEEYLGGIAGQGAWIGAPRTYSVSFNLDF